MTALDRGGASLASHSMLSAPARDEIFKNRNALRLFCSSSCDRTGSSTMRYITFAPLLLLAGAAAGVPLGFALSQASPQMRVDVVLRHVVSDLPQPVDVQVLDDRWDPGAETGMHDHAGQVILAVIEGELVEETPAGRNALCAGNELWRAARQIH